LYALQTKEKGTNEAARKNTTIYFIEGMVSTDGHFEAPRDLTLKQRKNINCLDG
jgi:hypothetical protein